MTAININGVTDIIPSSDGNLTLNIPINIKRWSGCKRITLPNGETGTRHKPLEPTPLQRTLVRGHRWLTMLELGEVKTIREPAAREGVDNRVTSTG